MILNSAAMHLRAWWQNYHSCALQKCRAGLAVAKRRFARKLFSMTHPLHIPDETTILANPPSVSFEFFPPKSDEQVAKLWESIRALEALNPRFVSVTYGAGGSTRDRTHQLVRRIREETSLEPAAHLTCVGSTKDEIRTIAEAYWEAGIRHIVALRGDAPASDGVYTPHPEGYGYADELVAGLLEIGAFEISVAAYPETHPQAASPEADLAHLKRKFDAGAHQAITQYFFDTPRFADFLARMQQAGITAPVWPGVLPIGNYSQMVKFSAMCGAHVPEWLHRRFEGVNDPSLSLSLAVATAAEQCRLLMGMGCSHLHFYTLNRPDLVIAICRMIGVFARDPA